MELVPTQYVSRKKTWHSAGPVHCRVRKEDGVLLVPLSQEVVESCGKSTHQSVQVREEKENSCTPQENIQVDPIQ